MTGTAKIKCNDLKKAYETGEFTKNGGSIGCGHDIPKNLDYGDVFYCERCGQFLSVIKALPWVCKNIFDSGTKYEENHIAGKWYIPVEARITWNNYKTIKPFIPGKRKKRDK